MLSRPLFCVEEEAPYLLLERIAIVQNFSPEQAIYCSYVDCVAFEIAPLRRLSRLLVRAVCHRRYNSSRKGYPASHPSEKRAQRDRALIDCGKRQNERSRLLYDT